MRTIHTFILRLLVDSAEPDAIRGALQVANQNQEPQPFIGETALLGLLKRLVTLDGQPGNKDQEHKENNP
jgi:hypothetical protein